MTVAQHPELDGLPLLALMSPDVRRLVEACLVPVAFGFGEVIVREGDEADGLYVLTAGTARAVKAAQNGDEVALRVLHAGDAVGEVALLHGGRRTATVRASGAVEALRLDRGVFAALLLSHPEVRQWAELQARQYELGDFLRVQSAFAALPSAALVAMLAHLRTVDRATGETVIRQGDGPGPLYVVREGRLRVTREQDGRTETVNYLRRGDTFGERSLLLGEPRAATVQAVTECRLLELRPEVVHRLIDEHAGFRADLEERVARYDFRRIAHVPLDFAEELAPAEARAAPAPPEQIAPVEPLPEEPDSGEPLEDDLFQRPERAIRRFPHLWQIDEADCGAACLAMACRYYGRRVDLAHVRTVAGTGVDGTSLHGLVVGAEQLGLAARARKASKSTLDALPLPAVCHWEGNHWVVLYDVDERHVRVADPASGLRRIARPEFEAKWSGYCALVARTPALDDLPEPRPAWRWLGPFARPHRRTLLIAVGLAFVAAALQMLIPVFAGIIVDDAIAEGDHALLHVLALGMLGVLVAAVGASLVQRWLLARMAVKFDAATLDHLTERLLALPLSYFRTRRTGDLERRLAGMRLIRTFLVQEGLAGLTAATQILVAIVLMVLYSPLLALVYLATVPLYALSMRWSRRHLRPLLGSLEEAFGKYHSRQIDAIKGIEAAKARGAEPGLARAMRRQFDDLADRVVRADLAFMGYDAAVQLLTFLTLALVLWAGGLLVLADRLTIGELVAFNGLVLLATGPVAIVLRMWDELQYSTVLLGRLDDVLGHEPEQGADRSALRPVPTLGGRVSLQGMGFAAPGPTPVPILEDISLEVESGMTVALVGRSGSGKTTLVSCLAGLIVPTEGRILFDGVDLRELDHRELRRRIGFVLQDDHLFDETIATNIALGEDKPDPERIRWAAGVAGAAEFIERLPLGYDTRVGETGLRVSGGQAQRIAIARAVYRRPPILILDEATSSLDADSERAVKENLDALLGGRTAFVIAHRLSTVRDADLIVVLERGRIAERGTHAELVARRGLYWYLVSQQLET